MTARERIKELAQRARKNAALDGDVYTLKLAEWVEEMEPMMSDSICEKAVKAWGDEIKPN